MEKTDPASVATLKLCCVGGFVEDHMLGRLNVCTCPTLINAPAALEYAAGIAAST